MHINISRRLLHAPLDLLDMVADVNRYPEFINFISAVRILQKEQLPNNMEMFIADVNVRYKMFSEVFRSKVVVDRQNNRIMIEKYGSGAALRELDNVWTFTELSDGSTQIDFDLNVSLKSSMLQMLLGKKMDKAANIILAAFERRASEICPPAGDSGNDIAMV